MLSRLGTMSKSKEFASNAEEFISENRGDAVKRITDFVDDSDTVDQVKKLAKDANEFVQKNPWTAVVGALVIGYILGSAGKKRN